MVLENTNAYTPYKIEAVHELKLGDIAKTTGGFYTFLKGDILDVTFFADETNAHSFEHVNSPNLFGVRTISMHTKCHHRLLKCCIGA